MRFFSIVQAHSELTAVTSDQHHAQLHRAAHESAGADRIGQGRIRLSNNIPLEALDTAGAAFDLIRLNAVDQVRIGNSAYRPQILGSANLETIIGGVSYVAHTTRDILIAVKAADEIVNNSAALQNDDDLVLAVEANVTYSLCMFLFSNIISSITLDGAFAVPTGAAITGTIGSIDAGLSDLSIETSYQNLAGNSFVLVLGRVIVGVNAGNVQFQWAQGTATAEDTKVLQGSTLMLIREMT